MDYNKHRLGYRFFVLNIICCACVLAVAVSGCTPLRRKFTRKKKKDREQSEKFIPILEPVDYEVKTYSSQDRYKQHYSLWQIWNRDLLQAIQSEGSDKRQKYLLGQTIEQLEAMKEWLGEEKQKELVEAIDDLRKVRKEFEKTSAMRSKFSMRKKIERNAKKVRKEFSPKLPLAYRE